MKNTRRSFFLLHQLLTVLGLIFLILANPPSLSAAEKKHYSEETIISLNFENKTLNQVLKEISWVTGYSFVINKKYADLKVSVALDKVPLHQGLKEIVGNHSHTITYEPNKTISLTLYKSSPPAPPDKESTDLYSPLNYTIRPNKMDESASESMLEEAETSTKNSTATAQWKELSNDIQSVSDEESYLKEELEGSPGFISQKEEESQIKRKEGELGISDRFNESQNYYEETAEEDEVDDLEYELQ